MREETLLELASSDTTDLPATCRAVTEAASTLVGVARASVWRLAGDELVCDDLFLRDEARHVSGQTIPRTSCPAYFDAVERSVAVVAGDARADRRTRELDASYLMPLGIGAMLDTPLWQPGAPRGVLCCEHVGGPRRWTGGEERDAARLADLVARSMEASSRRAAEERARVILEAIPYYVLIVDPEGQVIGASAITKSAIEDEGGSVLSERFEDLELHDLAGRLIPRARWPAERARRGETVCAEIVLVRSRVTGREKWLRATSAPVMVGDTLHGAVALYDEIGGEVRIEQVKREVLGAVAHALRTPATVAKGFAQRLAAAPRPSVQETRAMAVIERATGRIQRLSEALVDLSAITLGRIVLFREEVDLVELARRAVEAASAARGHAVRVIPRDGAVRALVDAVRVERVITELVVNAAHCSPAGSDIAVEISAWGDSARIAVRDHGIGIPLAAQPSVFEPLFHAHAGRPEDIGGVGVGLFLARETVVRHGGAITFESAPGAGSTFIVTLPRGVAGEGGRAGEAAAPPFTGGPRGPATCPPGSARTPSPSGPSRPPGPRARAG